jgi:DNA adenine methylase
VIHRGLTPCGEYVAEAIIPPRRYSQEDFDNLLKLLETLKGKFLLSSYRNKSLKEFIRENNWFTLELKMPSSMTHGGKTQRNKVEALTANYPIEVKLEKPGKRKW